MCMLTVKAEDLLVGQLPAQPPRITFQVDLIMASSFNPSGREAVIKSAASAASPEGFQAAIKSAASAAFPAA